MNKCLFKHINNVLYCVNKYKNIQKKYKSVENNKINFTN